MAGEVNVSNVSKVIYNGEVLIDLTGDTVTADKLLSGVKAHNAAGGTVTGTCTYDADTQDATAIAAEILSGKTAYNKGVKVAGTMKNNGAVSGSISTKSGTYTVPQGYHDGSGKVGIASSEQAKLTPANIRQGVTILGVEGTMSPNEGEKGQTKTVIPTASGQTIVPDTGYTCLTSVTVDAIPYKESANSAGGMTVTIG